MIQFKNILLFSVVFILAGELTLRFDKAFSPMEENRIVKIPTDIKKTPEYNMLLNNSLPLDDSNQRIMVVGDSYIHGGGINFYDNFSQQLKKLYDSEVIKGERTWVLDVSKSSSNTLDNYYSYFQFVEKYRPNFVIFGYNLNDIEGNLDKKNLDSLEINVFKESQIEGTSSVSNIKKLYNIIQTSHVVHFILKRVHRSLNEYGIIFPNSKFDVLMKSYYQDRDNWKKSKGLMNEIIVHADENDIQLIFYKFANLSKFPELFDLSDAAIREYFRSKEGIIYIEGNDHFDVSKAMEYRLSKIDGHPNEKAHKIMADHVYDVLKKEK